MKAHAPESSTAQIETLTGINLQDMFENLGLDRFPRVRRPLAWLFTPAARALALRVAQMDAEIAAASLPRAANRLLREYIHRLDAVGVEHIPAAGGVLFAANHPGMTDTLACFAGIPRADLRVVSNDRPFMRALPNISERTFYVPDDPRERPGVVRQVTRYLQAGGAVLIFPAGQIEPDPAVMPGAVQSLDEWSASLGLFMRLAPQAVVIPTAISGVIHGPSLHHPLTRLRREHKARERVAATVQAVALNAGWIRRQMRVRVEFGAPLRAADLAALGDTMAITRAITGAVRPLLTRPGQAEESAPAAHPQIARPALNLVTEVGDD